MRYRILLKDKVDEEIIRRVQSKHRDDVEGIDELYNMLIQHGTCDSHIVSRIYYVAYTLSLENIEMVIVRLN